MVYTFFILFFENFTLNVQINVSFKAEHVNKDIQKRQILVKMQIYKKRWNKTYKITMIT